jgi:hypothetical protein
MVLHAGVTPVTELDRGIAAVTRLVADPGLDGVTGRYFDGEREARPHPQAHDEPARRRLHELSDRLAGLTPA